MAEIRASVARTVSRAVIECQKRPGNGRDEHDGTVCDDQGQRADHEFQSYPRRRRGRGTRRGIGRPLRQGARSDFQFHFRPEGGRGSGADHAPRRRQWIADRRAGSRKDASRGHVRHRARHGHQAHPVHARPDAGRYRRLRGSGRSRGRTAHVPLRQGTGVLPAADGRRNQPRVAAHAIRAAAGDAGAPCHRRRPALRPSQAVPCARDAEPARAGRHLSAARSAARPLPDAGRRRLSRPRGREADADADDGRRRKATAGAC